MVGMGTWLTFDIGRSTFELARRRQVLQAFYAGGGRVIDSSPMYGRAEAVVGELLPQAGGCAPDVFRHQGLDHWSGGWRPADAGFAAALGPGAS